MKQVNVEVKHTRQTHRNRKTKQIFAILNTHMCVCVCVHTVPLSSLSTVSKQTQLNSMQCNKQLILGALNFIGFICV